MQPNFNFNLKLNPPCMYRTYEEYDKLCYRIKLPKRFFLSCFRDFAWFFCLGALIAYNFLILFSFLIWGIGLIDIYIFAKIWRLHNLSLGKLIVFMFLMIVAVSVIGVLLRSVLAQIITNPRVFMIWLR